MKPRFLYTILFMTALTALTIGVVLLTYGYVRSTQRNATLEAELRDLTEKEKRSAIMRSISSQMGEIAYQQKEISDEQRIEAQQQSRIANEMRMRSEIERQNALEAERNALEAERKAIEASQMADSQREVAERQREQAEYARNMADTLSYQALARSLGSLATTQESTGNHDLATLLAYAAYTFTERYKGDVYQPTIFEAMSLTSKSSQTWAIHRGSIIKLQWESNNDTRFFTLSTYGELFEHNLLENKRLSTIKLFQNSQYDLRDMTLYNDNTLYSVSRSGDLLVTTSDRKTLVHHIEGAIHPFRIYKKSNELLTIVAENGLFLLNRNTLQKEKEVLFDHPINIAGQRENNHLLFFGEGQSILECDSTYTQLDSSILPFKEVVFSYGWIESNDMDIYGTTDGVINLLDKEENLIRLVGHRSRVSRIIRHTSSSYFNSNQQMILTTSYDGTVKLWNLSAEKIEPINVLNSNNWVISCAEDSTGNYLWTGDQKGNLTQTLISVPIMAERLKQSLSREFTPEEWVYYIGSNIPYETFKDK